MRSKLLNPDPPIAYAIVLDTGDKVMEELSSFKREHAVEAASITAIGAFRRASLGYFEWQTKQYKRIAVDEQVEVLSLLGDVAVAEEEPSLHIHTVLGRADGSVVGAHFHPGGYSLSEREREIAVIIINSKWHSAYPTNAHERRGKEVGLPPEKVEAMLSGLPTSFADEREQIVYKMAICLGNSRWV
jgi:uncharacterized protein